MRTEDGAAAFWRSLDRLVSSMRVIIDRPKGSRHPRFPNLVYPLDYGYLDGLSSTDGNPLDVWKGTKPGGTVDAVVCVVDLNKMDTEFKVVLSCFAEEIEVVDRFQNTGGMSGIVVRRWAG